MKIITFNDSNSQKDKFRALVFFAQLVQESLFDYTFDTYKLPSLNISVACDEILYTIKGIEKKSIRKSTLQSLLREFAHILKKDPIVNLIIDKNTLRKKIDKFNKEDVNLEDIKEIFKYINTSLSYKNKYIELSRQKIMQAISNNEVSDELRHITISYVIELIRNGYSKEYIFYSIERLFFSNQFDNDLNKYICEFFNLFNLKTEKFIVYIGVEDKFKNILDAETLKHINYESPVSVSIKNRQEVEKENNLNHCLNEGDNDLYFVVFDNIEELDRYRARSVAIDRINFFVSIAQTFVHKERFYFSKKAYVFNKNDKTDFAVDASINQMLKIEDIKIDDLQKHIRRITKHFFIKRFIYKNQNIQESLSLHKTALDEINKKNQFLNLWSAIELLFPNKEKALKDIINMLTSVNMFKYIEKIFLSARRDLQHMNNDKINNLVNSIDAGKNYYEKFRNIVIMKKYKDKLKKLLDMLTDNPLMQYRLIWISNSYSNPQKTLDILKYHKERIEWQIERLYRTRNMLIHASDPPRILDRLICNLHYYFDLMINILYEISGKNRNIDTMSQVFCHIALIVEKKEADIYEMSKMKDAYDEVKYIDCLFSASTKQ